MSPQNPQIEGAGPFVLEVDTALNADDIYTWNFRNEPYNGTKGGFRKYLPFDIAQVTNLDSSAPIKATFNGIYETYIPPNTTETFDKQGVTKARVRNAGTTTINSGNVVVEVKTEPYGADDAARESKFQPPIFKAAKTPLGGFL